MRSFGKFCLVRERHVVFFAGLSGLLHLIICISLAIVWTYWSNTLNNCSEIDCGCILFGRLRGQNFVGGHPMWCRLFTYYALIATIVSFVIAGYFFLRIRNSPKNIPSRVSQQEDESVPHQRIRTQFSRGFIVFCGCLLLLSFVYACTMTEGYWTTCDEYKTLVIKNLKASGDLSDLVMDRLSCGSKYDFLDYLQPDAIVRYPQYVPQYYHHRTFRINTGSILLSSIISAWINVFIWGFLTLFISFCK